MYCARSILSRVHDTLLMSSKVPPFHLTIEGTYEHSQEKPFFVKDSPSLTDNDLKE